MESSKFLTNLNLRPGGKWSSETYLNNNNATKLAIIVPYRNREINLKAFLVYMHHFLTEQNITQSYAIYIIEPTQGKYRD